MIDLRQCQPGDKLLTKHGTTLVYVEQLADSHHCDHLIKYPNGGGGFRTHSGHVFRNPSVRMDEDEDIVEILTTKSDSQ